MEEGVPSQMRVRDAVAEDLPEITAIYGYSVLNELATFELDPPSEEVMLERWRTVRDGGYPYLVAVDAEDRVAGYAYTSAFRPRPAYRATVENSVYVGPDFRRAGVGRLLLSVLVDRCAAASFREMIAAIGDPENAGSVPLHQALGFRTVGTLQRVGRKFDRWVDVVMMQKTL